MNRIEIARYKLLFYGMKYEWVRKRIMEEKIDFGLNNLFSEEEIEDYIKVIKTESTNKKIEILNDEFKITKNPLKQAEILNEILLLKKKQNNGYEVNN